MSKRRRSPLKGDSRNQTTSRNQSYTICTRKFCIAQHTSKCKIELTLVTSYVYKGILHVLRLAFIFPLLSTLYGHEEKKALPKKMENENYIQCGYFACMEALGFGSFTFRMPFSVASMSISNL